MKIKVNKDMNSKIRKLRKLLTNEKVNWDIETKDKGSPNSFPLSS